jgi:cellobiose epimerase
MTASTRQRLVALAVRLDELARRSMRLWLDAGLDPLGGAHGFLDRSFRPLLDEDDAPRGPSGEVRGDQSLVQQARHLYAHSLYAERRPEETRAVEFAHALYAHLLAAFETEGAFIHVRSRDGRVRSQAVELYAQGFGIFALATYGRVFGVKESVLRGLRHFEALDARLHDDDQGGYDQRHDGSWLRFVSAPPGAAKCTNTHIHTLEALTAHSRALPSAALVRQRLLELTSLIATRLPQESGYLPLFFDAAWRPVGPERVSYGHDVETAWLLLDALDVLQASGDVPSGLVASARSAAQSMVRHALRTGWDPAGGFFDHGIPEGASKPSAALGRDKVWWAQAEALPGLYRTFRLSGDDSLVTRLEMVADFLSERSWDQEYGGYFWSVDSLGQPLGRGDHKGELWKTPYHDVRACVLTADWIREDA